MTEPKPTAVMSLERDRVRFKYQEDEDRYSVRLIFTDRASIARLVVEAQTLLLDWDARFGTSDRVPKVLIGSRERAYEWCRQNRISPGSGRLVRIVSSMEDADRELRASEWRSRDALVRVGGLPNELEQTLISYFESRVRKETA
jgi:hypothetical protein